MPGETSRAQHPERPAVLDADGLECGDAACWLARVCGECGAFREPSGPCSRCGAEPAD